MMITLLGWQHVVAQQEPDQNPEPIVPAQWQEASASVYDLDEAAKFFMQIGGYEIVWRGEEDSAYLKHMGLEDTAKAESLLLSAPGFKTGHFRLTKFLNVEKQMPIRPGSRAWDTGCFSSIMVRAKNLESIFDDAIKLGWWTETPITDVDFGGIQLKIVTFKGPQGLQVQAYERINQDLPDSFPEFARFSGPFNIWQTVKNRDDAKSFFVDILGAKILAFTEPTVAETPRQIPMGIPLNLTTTSRYQAGILHSGNLDLGRLELVEFLDLTGVDYSQNCRAPNFGTFSIKYEVNSVEETKKELRNRGIDQKMEITNMNLQPYGAVDMFSIKTPDGANIEFYSR